MIFFFVNPHCNVVFDLKIWLAITNTLTSARGYTCAVYLLSFMSKRKMSKRAPLGKRGEEGGGVARTQRPPLPSWYAPANVWLKIYIYCTQLNKRRIFLLGHLLWLTYFILYIREIIYEYCFLFHKRSCLFEFICFIEDSYFIFIFSFNSYKQDL